MGAVAWALTAGVGMSLGWLATAPPQAFGSAPYIVAALLAVTMAVGAMASSDTMRHVVGAWLVVVLSIVWSCLGVTRLLVVPGANAGAVVILVLLGAIGGLVVILGSASTRWRHRRIDAISGLLMTCAMVVALIVSASTIVDAGRRLRLDRVRDDYEQAIADDRVVEAGGFVEGDLAGWVWANKLVLDPLSGVVFARPTLSMRDAGGSTHSEKAVTAPASSRTGSTVSSVDRRRRRRECFGRTGQGPSWRSLSQPPASSDRIVMG